MKPKNLSSDAARDVTRLRVERLEPRLMLTATTAINYAATNPTWFETLGTVQRSAFNGNMLADSMTPPAADDGRTSIAGSRWIVRLTEAAVADLPTVGAADAAINNAALGLSVIGGLGRPGQLLIVATSPDEAIAASFQANPLVASFERDQLVSTLQMPNDPFFSNQIGLHNTGQFGATVDVDVDAPEAWDLQVGSPTVVVAVIDSGIDAAHPDLYRNIWLNQGEIPASLRPQLVDDGDGLITFWDLNSPPNANRVLDFNGNQYIDAQDVLNDPAWANGLDTDANGFVDDFFGWDFRDDSSEPLAPNNPSDVLGHGTHVAGTIGAIGNNGVGVAGVNWRTSLMSLKFLDETNQGSVANAIRALNYAEMMRTRAADPVNVRATNNSWGQTGGFSAELSAAIAATGDAGILFVTAAGNGNVLGQGINNDFNPFYPAGYDLPNVVSVAAIGPDGLLADFSNFGNQSVDLGAPGVGVLSTIPGGGYATANGTSMAAPHVTGAAALLWSDFPDASVAEVRSALFAGADVTPELTPRTAADGRINLLKTLQADVFAPRADLVSAPDIVAASATPQRIRITYFDRIGVNEASLGANDLLIARQWGPRDQLAATLDAGSIIVSPDGKQVTADYLVTAPGGSWDPLDFGDYEIRLQLGAVVSDQGRPVAAGAIGAFHVEVVNPAFYYVNTLVDSADANPGNGVAADAQGRTSLRAAIQEANALGGARTIVLDVGEHRLTLVGAGENAGATGDLDVAATITILGDSADASVIHAGAIDRALDVHAGGNLTLRRVQATGGLAPDGQGGGVRTAGTLAVDLSAIINNAAAPAPEQRGGGVYVVSGTATILDSTVAQNAAVEATVGGDGYGGGVAVGGGATATIKGSLVWKNRAFEGGGLYVFPGGTANVENSTFSENVGVLHGGAINNIGSATFVHVTITNNSSVFGNGGVAHSGSQASFRNSIVAGNTGGFLEGDIEPVTSLGYNLFGTVNPPNNWLLPTDQVRSDAASFLGALQDNGGPARTHALLPGSTAIDRANPATFLTIDQRGVSRPHDGDGNGSSLPDIGAVEAFSVEISGVLFNDLNHNGFQESTELSLGGRVVFLDTNANGALDPGERFVLTTADDPTTPSVDEGGKYAFRGLTPGNYRLVQQVQPGWIATTAGGSRTTRLTVASGMTDSIEPSVSRDGRFVAYRTSAAGEGIDVFDRQRGVVQRVVTNANVIESAISGDGRFIAYMLFPNSVRIYDRQTGADLPVGTGLDVAVSDDGRYVAVPGRVYDRQLGNFKTFAADVFGGDEAAISASGQFVAYNSGNNVSVFDQFNLTTDLVSVNSSGTPSNARSVYPAISSDGRYVVFCSAATNLVPGAANGKTQVYWVDRQTDEIRLISKSPNGEPGNGHSFFAEISGDGRFVAFSSDATNLLPGNFGLNAFVYDTLLGVIEYASISDGGAVGNSFSVNGPLDFDGSTVVFDSVANNLTPGLYNGSTEIFTRDRQGSDRAGVTFNLGAGEVISNLNFGAAPLPGTIRGRHFHDLIPNGVADPGEPGLPGWTVFLDANANGVLDAIETRTVTDAQGNYELTGLQAERDYVVALVHQGRDVLLPSADAGGVWQVSLGAGQVAADRDFGTRAASTGGQSQNASVSGRAFLDVNGNGQLDPGDAGLPGRIVFLDLNDDGIRQFDEPQTQTAGDGLYNLAQLGSLSGTVRMVAVASQTISAPKGNEFETFPYGVVDFAIQPGDLNDVTVADVNGDQLPDIAIAVANTNSNIGSSLALLLNNGAGGFQNPRLFQLTGALGAAAVVAARLNNNNLVDLAVVSSTNSRLTVLRDFDGANFTITTLAAGVGPSSLAAADIDRDNDVDLILANEFGSSLTVMRNNGSAVFTALSPFPSGGARPAAIVAGQFNDDNADGAVNNLDFIDLAVANAGTQPTGADFGNVAMFFNNGTGAFAAPAIYDAGDTVGVAPVGLAVGRLNGDAWLDLAVANALSDTVTILTGSQSGTFTGSGQLAAGRGPLDVSIGDVDVDGDSDIVVTTAGKDDAGVRILRNRLAQQSDEFDPAETLPAVRISRIGLTPFYHALEDVNGDGTLEILLGDAVHHELVVKVNHLVNGGHRVALNGVAALSNRNFAVLVQAPNADFDSDQDVDARDFLAWQRGFGKTTGATRQEGNADGDADVDAADFAAWKNGFGTHPSAQVQSAAAAAHAVVAELRAVPLSVSPDEMTAQLPPARPRKLTHHRLAPTDVFDAEPTLTAQREIGQPGRRTYGLETRDLDALDEAIERTAYRTAPFNPFPNTRLGRPLDPRRRSLWMHNQP